MAHRLAEYRKKRRFGVTPEPPPEAPARRPGRAATFMVHKHDARRLHYDLRLEMDGALASFAIPKGPSYDTRTRRLAVQTEDHPLAYGSFEGRIPEGEYGAGDSIVWDRGTYDTVPSGEASAMRRGGHLVLELFGEKLRGRWHLVRTSGFGEKSSWLFFKGKDEYARPGYDVLAERPESVVSGKRFTRGPVRAAARSMATRTPEELARDAGIEPARGRVIAVVSRGKAAVFGHAGERVRMPARVERELAGLPVADAILEGRLDESRFRASALAWLDGEDLRGRSDEERRDRLGSVLWNAGSAIERPPVRRRSPTGATPRRTKRTRAVRASGRGARRTTRRGAGAS